MKLIALMPVRNEDWILGLGARAALMWCDELVVLNHASTDGTLDILLELVTEYPGRVHYLSETENSTWEEMRHRQRMLTMARDCGATHIALVDADEVLTGNLLPMIRGHVESTPKGTILQLPWLCLKDGIDQVITSGMWGQQNVSTAFPDEPAFHWAARDGYDFHHRHPMGGLFRPYHQVAHRGGGLMHLQFASHKRLIAKQYWYQIIERLRWPDRTMPDYVGTVQKSDAAQTSPVPSSWWEPYLHLLQYLHVDREPWQLAEVKRTIAENPGIEVGLNDFGLLESGCLK